MPHRIDPATGKRITGRPFLPGQSGNPAGGASRARRDLNADTIRAMHAAFREGGRQAINKVMKNQPAAFLKLLVLLVPRELEVTRSGGVKSMSDEQIEATIEAIQGMLAARATEEGAKVIEGVAGSAGEVGEVASPSETREDEAQGFPCASRPGPSRGIV
jgi:hypothetical protein